MTDTKVEISLGAYVGMMDIAANNYQKEGFCFLRGKITKKKITVDSIAVSPYSNGFAWLDYKDKYKKEVESISRKHGLEIVGDFHSHPYPKNRGKKNYTTCKPSKTDLQYMDKIKIICCVNPSKRKEDHVEYFPQYIHRIMNTNKGRLNFRTRVFRKNKKGKAEQLEIILSEDLMNGFNKIRKAGNFFMKKRIELEK